MTRNTITGAEILIRTFIEEGCDTVFGYPGGTIMPIYDSLYDHRVQIRHILVRHEQGAVHAAQGYARSTGKVGICMATAGPGATNLVTGIADAMMDSTPVVCITAQVNADKLGTNFFQEADMIDITLPITKWSYQITSAQEIPCILARAFYIAATGRPGPVLISLTKNAQTELAEYRYDRAAFVADLLSAGKGVAQDLYADDMNICSAVEKLNAAERPLIIAGQGINISCAWDVLEECAVKGNIPVAVTLLGKGCISGKSPLFAGMVGMHGNIAPNAMTQEADVILAVGMRFSDRVTGEVSGYAPKAFIIHIDIDRTEFGKNIKADMNIQGDAHTVLAAVASHIKYSPRKEWLSFMADKKDYEEEIITRPLLRDDGGRLKMAQVVTASITESASDPGRIIVTDVGQNQMFCARHSIITRRLGWITSGGLGTMGFGLPAAIGAKVGNPTSEVLLFTGDGGFQMNIQELGTILQNGIHIKIILLNNSWLGMVRQWQELFFHGKYSYTHLVNPDFQRLAEAYSIRYARVRTLEELHRQIPLMLSYEGSFLLEAVVEEMEDVFPMIPAGQTLNQIIYKK